MTGAITEAASARAAGGDGATQRRHRSSTRTLVEWVIIVAVALLAATVAKTYVVEAYYIPSASMSPAIKVGDRVLVDKLSYDFATPQRGNIIVFAKPPTDIDPGVTDLIKRVVGLPGQTIQSRPDGTILINGRAIAEPWLTASARADPGPAIPQMTVPKGDYYVMGDNRDDSDDSRYFGPIPGRLIIGRAVVRVWPLSRARWW